MRAMRIGIDWVAVVLLLGAYAFAQIRAVPVRVRYGVSAAAFGAIALFRLRAGATGLNLIVALVAAGFAVLYLIKAFQAGGRRSG